MNPSPEESARELLEVIPVVMRDIRSQMRSRRSPDLTVPQFRALGFVDRNRGSSLSDVAYHMGLTLPSTSKLVDGLISRGLMAREEHPDDRRRLKLAVTRRGLSTLETSRSGTLAYLSAKLGNASGEQRELIVGAMGALRSIFSATAYREQGVK